MDKQHYEEMVSSFNQLPKKEIIRKQIYLFGHCNATEELADYLLENGYKVEAILDNNSSKYKNTYRDIKIIAPMEIMKINHKNTIVLIVARAYAAMAKQLNHMGFKGEIKKLIDYNSFAEYSLSEDTIYRMKHRLNRGISLLNAFNNRYDGIFKIFCPFSALGDVYIMMSYLPCFLKKRRIDNYMIFVVGNGCMQVVKLFGNIQVESLSQKDMDEVLQAVIYTNDNNSFIAHQDRPYIINLHKALYVKCIPLETIYCCGIFGLPIETSPVEASEFTEYNDLASIPKGKSVILSPYAKSVTAIPMKIWNQIVNDYKQKGYTCFTNIVGNETALKDTIPISPKISEIKSVVERAGTFIGIRSGLCDVIRNINAKKIALYPDYNYSDTKWKAVDMYLLKDWENIVVKDDFQWKT